MINLNKRGGFRAFFLSLIVVVFFSVVLISMSVNLLQVSNPSSDVLQPIGDNENNFSLLTIQNNLENSFGNVTDEINRSKTDLSGAVASPLEFLFVIVKETVSIPINIFKVMTNLIAVMTSSFINLLSAQLGLPPMVSTGLTLLFYGLWVVAIFLTIRLVRSGQD